MPELNQSIEIHFRGRPDAIKFTRILGYQLGSGFLGVMTIDGITYIYPQDTIEYVVHTQSPQE